MQSVCGFQVSPGLRQGCVMDPWLFNLFTDGVMWEVKVRVMGRGIALIWSEEDQVWDVSYLLFMDDTVLVADSE